MADQQRGATNDQIEAANNKEEARQAYERGMLAWEIGEEEEAKQLFALSQRLYPTPKAEKMLSKASNVQQVDNDNQTGVSEKEEKAAETKPGSEREKNEDPGGKETTEPTTEEAAKGSDNSQSHPSIPSQTNNWLSSDTSMFNRPTDSNTTSSSETTTNDDSIPNSEGLSFTTSQLASGTALSFLLPS